MVQAWDTVPHITGYSNYCTHHLRLSCGSATLVQVIQDHAEEFLDKMNSKEIESKLMAMKLIPEGTANSIKLSKDKEEANTLLLTHLKEDADESEIKETFRIASEKPGFGKMNSFADFMRRKMQGGWFCRVHCTHAVVEILVCLYL